MVVPVVSCIRSCTRRRTRRMMMMMNLRIHVSLKQRITMKMKSYEWLERYYGALCNCKMEPPHHDPAIYIIGRILDPNVVPVTFENVVVVACSNPSFRLHDNDLLLAGKSQLPVVKICRSVCCLSIRIRQSSASCLKFEKARSASKYCKVRVPWNASQM